MLKKPRSAAAAGSLSAIALVLASVMASPPQAAAAESDQGQQSFIMGAGALPCAEFGQRIRNKTEIEETFFAWGQGYMSGMNTMFDVAGAETRDMNAVSLAAQEDRVRTFCASHPLQSYSDGISELYFSLPIVPARKNTTP